MLITMTFQRSLQCLQSSIVVLSIPLQSAFTLDPRNPVFLLWPGRNIRASPVCAYQPPKRISSSLKLESNMW